MPTVLPTMSRRGPGPVGFDTPELVSDAAVEDDVTVINYLFEMMSIIYHISIYMCIDLWIYKYIYLYV